MDQGPAYAALKPGSMFAWVAIGPELGRGPTGTVYRAQHARLDRICAIKVIAPDLSRDPEFRERFLRASRRAGSFEHAHVVRLYDIGEDNGLLYLAMELVDGRDLGRLVDWRGPLAPESAVAIVTPVAEALQAAHDLGLVHGNVKPANILVSNAGARVYLSDLALGPVITAAYTRRLSESGDAPSPYLAPEQLLGDPIDRRADVYALGRVVQAAGIRSWRLRRPGGAGRAPVTLPWRPDRAAQSRLSMSSSAQSTRSSWCGVRPPLASATSSTSTRPLQRTAPGTFRADRR